MIPKSASSAAPVHRSVFRPDCYVREWLTFELLRWLNSKIAPNAAPSATPIATLCAMFPDDAPYAAPIATPIATQTPILFPFPQKLLFGLLFVVSSTSLILVPTKSCLALLCSLVSESLFVRQRHILATSSTNRCVEAFSVNMQLLSFQINIDDSEISDATGTR